MTNRHAYQWSTFDLKVNYASLDDKTVFFMIKDKCCKMFH